MDRYEQLKEESRATPRRWAVTGVAGFIGSNLLEELLRLDQEVVGLDNFDTGYPDNLDQALRAVGPRRARGFRFLEGDVCDASACDRVCEGADFVLHQAALGSVPRSLDDPVATNRANVDGHLTVLAAARRAGVKRFVYASSSSVYGDDPGLPKVEGRIGRPLSPYAASKQVAELYAEVFHRCYGFACTGLRYFNVFGPRQDPEGPYAAVIPRWIGQLLEGEVCEIYGDGETSRDFCYVDNVIQANLLAAHAGSPGHEVYNVACGERLTLNELFVAIRDGLAAHRPHLSSATPAYGDFRPGDVRHSEADIGKIESQLGYRATHTAREGLRATLEWYMDRPSADREGRGEASAVRSLSEA